MFGRADRSGGREGIICNKHHIEDFFRKEEFAQEQNYYSKQNKKCKQGS